MTAELRRGLLLVGIGVIGGLAIIVALYGPNEFLKKARAVVESAQTPRTLADRPDTPPSGEKQGDAGAGAKDDKQANVAPGGGPDAKGPAGSDEARNAPRDETKSAAKSAGAPDETKAPSLDIIRVEPNGDSVIAGRSAPNASVEILRDNQPIAKATADPSGQFAITPPTLPAGNSEITFRSVAPDGKETKAKESVVVVVAENRTSKPLVAVSTPDKPTQVLSQPEAPAEGKSGAPDLKTASRGDDAAARADGGKSAQADKPAAQAESAKPKQPEKPPQVAALPDKGGKPTGAEASPVRIVSVDAQDGGRLDIAGRGTAWSTLRLYLNDTLVATGQAGPDGAISFTIGKGVKAGGYQIRVDQVDPASGKVEHRAQVAFAVPESAASKLAANAPAAAPRAQAKSTAQPTKQAEAKAAPPAPIPAKPDAAPNGVGGLADGPSPSRESRAADIAAKTTASPPSAPAAEGRVGQRPADEGKPSATAAAPARAGEGSSSATAAKPDTRPERPAAGKPGEGDAAKLPTMAQAPLPSRTDDRAPGAAAGGGATAQPAPTPPSPTPPPSGSQQRTAPETPSVAGAAKPGDAQPTPESDAKTAQALAPKLPRAAAAQGAPPSDQADATATPPAANPAAPTMLPPTNSERLAETPTPGAVAAAPVAPSQPEPSVDPAPKPGSVFVPEINTAKITRGDNLWQISRKSYGNGYRYTVIFDANREQIKDPDLIYPGQIFVLPKDEAGAKRG